MKSTWKSTILDAEKRVAEKRDPFVVPLFPAPGYYTRLLVDLAEKANWQNPSIKKGSPFVCMLNPRWCGQNHLIEHVRPREAADKATKEEAARQVKIKDMEEFLEAMRSEAVLPPESDLVQQENSASPPVSVPKRKSNRKATNSGRALIGVGRR